MYAKNGGLAEESDYLLSESEATAHLAQIENAKHALGIVGGHARDDFAEQRCCSAVGKRAFLRCPW
jgi:hypothetical protein